MEDGLWLPWPPGEARFGYTILGRVDRAPTVTIESPAALSRVSPGDTLAVVWNATDPDEVSTIEIRLEPAMGTAIVLARFTRALQPLEFASERIPTLPTAARVAVPCVPAGDARLLVRASDSRGRLGAGFRRRRPLRGDGRAARRGRGHAQSVPRGHAAHD
jgi:hypothetical protein